MAFKRTVDIIEPDGETINTTLVFWGETEDEADAAFEGALGSWPVLDAAVKAGRITDETHEVDESELPEVESDDGEEIET